VRPGTLVVIIVLLVAMILFGFFLLSDGERRPSPGAVADFRYAVVAT